MPTKTPKTPPHADPAEAYAQARADLATVRRQGGADEPVAERVERELPDRIVEFQRLHPSRLEAAQKHVLAAERALQAAHGPAAVRLADAKARHLEATAAVQAAEEGAINGTAHADLGALVAAEAVAARQVGVLETAAARHAQAYEKRLALDTTHADTLEQATSRLETLRTTLSEKAAAAEQALFALVAAADAYSEEVRAVSAQLSALGFTDTARYDGSTHDTAVSQKLRVSGRTWPHIHTAELLPRAVARVAYAVSDRDLYDAMRRHAGLRTYEADALLCDVPEPVPVARRRPRPAVAQRAEVGRPEPVLADKRNYVSTPARKPRFGPFGQRTA